ncbi:glycosyltransferase WbuB, partial [Acinetobacter baumannii]
MLDKFGACYIGLKKDPLFRFGVSPNKLFDYLYAGKPVIYAIDSGKYKPVSDAGAGYEVTPENTDELVCTIEKL